MSTAVLTDADVERIAQRTAELIRGTPASVAQDTIGTAELMVKLNCKSVSALYRTLANLGIQPFAHGKYRVVDVDNAIARASHTARKAAQKAA